MGWGTVPHLMETGPLWGQGGGGGAGGRGAAGEAVGLLSVHILYPSRLQLCHLYHVLKWSPKTLACHLQCMSST